MMSNQTHDLIHLFAEFQKEEDIYTQKKKILMDKIGKALEEMVEREGKDDGK